MTMLYIWACTQAFFEALSGISARAATEGTEGSATRRSYAEAFRHAVHAILVRTRSAYSRRGDRLDYNVSCYELRDPVQSPSPVKPCGYTAMFVAKPGSDRPAGAVEAEPTVSGAAADTGTVGTGTGWCWPLPLAAGVPVFLSCDGDLRGDALPLGPAAGRAI